MKRLKTLTEILARYVWCVIIIAAILLLSLITLSFGEDVDLVSHLSLAGAVVSIVLAVIVIIYMYFQDYRTSQNITEMRKLIDEGNRIMTDKARVMVDKTESIEQMVAGMAQPTAADSQPVTQPLEIKEPLQFDVSAYSDGGIIILYALVKSHELGRPMSLRKIANLIWKDLPDTGKNLMLLYGMGIMQSLQAFLGKDSISITFEKGEIKMLPAGFKESIVTQFDNLLENYKAKERDEAYTFLKDSREAIDDYFDSL